MYFVYVDESGDSGMSPKGIPGGSSKHFIRAGVLIHKENWFKINTRIKEFRAAEGIPQGIEFHATEIHRGFDKKSVRQPDGKSVKKSIRNFWGRKYKTNEERRALVKRYIEEIVVKQGLEVITVAICKENIDPKQFISTKKDHDLKNRSLNFLTEKINHYVSPKKAKALLIFDHVGIVDDSKHRKYQRSIYRNSDFINNQNFIETICFAPSEESEILQLADMVSNTAYRHYALGETEVFNALKPAIFKEKIWPEKHV